MSRVTPEEVQEIIDTELTSAQITARITYATTFVDDYLDDGKKGLSEESLKEIERWLSAHLIAATTERPAIEEEAGPVRQRFSDIFTQGFNSTTYGQMAIGLDSSGTLAKMSDSKKPIVLRSIEE